MARIWALALLAAAMLAGCGTGTERGARDHDPWGALPRGWSSLAQPPSARAWPVAVWTGRELFYWGGETSGEEAERFPADGALYDAEERKWRRLPRGPLAGRSSPGAVWTGKEVFIWGGFDRGDGALFNPVTRAWRMLPPSPISPRGPVAVVWTGGEVLVWGDGDRSDGLAHREGAAYDPASQTWRKLPLAPFGLNQARGVWTGEELIVFGALLNGNNRSVTKHARGIAYDPTSNRWRVIAPSRLSPQASGIAWSGTELIAFDYELEAGAYDPRRDTWRRVDRLPLRFTECYPEGVLVDDVIVAWFCGVGATFDASAGTWSPTPRGFAGFAHSGPVGAGSVALYLGTSQDGAGGLWAYRP